MVEAKNNKAISLILTWFLKYIYIHTIFPSKLDKELKSSDNSTRLFKSAKALSSMTLIWFWYKSNTLRKKTKVTLSEYYKIMCRDSTFKLFNPLNAFFATEVNELFEMSK